MPKTFKRPYRSDPLSLGQRRDANEGPITIIGGKRADWEV